MKTIEKERARSLRKKGHSINQIVKETGFTKSSVSLWVRDIILTKEQKKKISEKGRSVESVERRRINRLTNEQARRQKIFDKAKEDYSSISTKELKLIGIILYLGEGGKTSRGMARMANSDPSVIKIMMRFFREICKVEENKFRAYIHTFTHADIEKTEKYWSKITGISRQQFFKTYTKPSSASLQKRDKLPYGTLDIYVCDTKLFLTITGWMEKIKELLTGDPAVRAL
jgi:L-fucose mutarotase/ribose pyranase (RbsD/FucU family)